MAVNSNKANRLPLVEPDIVDVVNFPDVQLRCVELIPTSKSQPPSLMEASVLHQNLPSTRIAPMTGGGSTRTDSNVHAMPAPQSQSTTPKNEFDVVLGHR